MKKPMMTLFVLGMTFNGAQAQLKKYSGVYYDSASSQYFVNDKPSFSIRSLGNGEFLDKIEYSINDDSFKHYQSQIKFNQEGLHLLRFKAVDPVNNWSPVQSFRIYVDLTQPKSQISWFGEHYSNGTQNFVSPNSQLVISASDNLSGIDSVLWKESPQAQPLIYNSKKSFSRPGPYNVQYSAVDNVGNLAPWETYSFIVDADKPATEAKLKGDVYQVEQKIYTNLGSLIELASVDKSSGVKEIEYTINNGQVQKYDQSFAIDKKVSKLKFRAKDNVGNGEDWKEFIVYLDTDSPEIDLKKEGVYQYVSGKIFAQPGFKLMATANDKDSGLKGLIVDGVEKASKKELMSFDKDGQFQVNYSALDNVGNKANPIQVDVVVDSMPPDSSFSTTLPLVERKGVFYSTIPNKVKITGVDDGVGLKHIEYSYDGKAFQKMSGDIDLATWQTPQRTIYYRAVDHLGNTEKTKQIVVSIRDKGPKVGLFFYIYELDNIPLSEVKDDKGRLPAGKR